MIVVAGQDAVVAEWAGRAMGARFIEPLAALGVVKDDGLLVGAAIFNDYHPGGNIEWSHVGPGTLSRKVLRKLFNYAFVQCGASRMTVKTRKSNKVVQSLLPRLGFKYEHTSKRYYDTTRDGDALCFVMFREQAERWFKEKVS